MLLTYFSWNGRFFHSLIIWTALLGWHSDLWNFIALHSQMTTYSTVHGRAERLSGLLCKQWNYLQSAALVTLASLPPFWIVSVTFQLESTKLVFFLHLWKAFAATWWLFWQHIVRVGRYIWFLCQNEMVWSEQILSPSPGCQSITILILTRNKCQPSLKMISV